MFAKIFSHFGQKNRPSACLPAGRRLYAVGDVHGCVDLLNGLIAQIETDDQARGGPQGDIIFLGDLINRGSHSAQVLDRLIDLKNQRPNTRFLQGNHEEVFLTALQGKIEAMRFFDRHGGRETMLSYGISAADYDAADLKELAAMVQAAVPAAHRQFLESFDNIIVEGDYIFAHAGVRPGVAIADQRPSDLRWIRDAFLHDPKYKNRPAIAGKTVVHGHSIFPSVTQAEGRIGVDTGAYCNGVLTALALEGESRWVLQQSDAAHAENITPIPPI